MRYLYLHGFASGPQSRKARFFRDRLASEGIALDVPALDEGDFEHLTISSQLALITRLLDGEPAVLIGSSMGGYLAALYASRHPEVDRIVMMAPAFGFGARWSEVFGEDNVSRWRLRGYADVFHYGTGCTQRLASELLDDSLQHDGYPKCTQPALIFHGLQDSVVPIEAAQQWSRDNPQSRLVPLASGHELLDVLDNIWERSRTFLMRTSEL